MLLGLVTFAGLAVRAIPVTVGDFPLNDGGLFVAMTRAIRDAGWVLPATLAWNGMDLPFIYPPLGFYLAGGLEALFGADLFEIFRWLPLVTATLVVPAVFLLGRTLLRSEVGGLVAALTYALAPVSYVWMVQGGGVTRSPGLLLAILTLWQSVQLVRQPTRRAAVLVGLLAGATALIHPGAAVFTAISGVLIWIFEGGTRRSFPRAAAALGIAAVVVAPWALIIIARHGLGAITDVPNNGPDPLAALLALLAGRVTGVPFMDPLAILGVALALWALIRRRWLLPLWYVFALVLSYQYAMIPFGLLVGELAIDLATLGAARRDSPATGSARWIPVVGTAALAACLIIEGVASTLTVLNPGAPVHALSPERRQANEWVAANLEVDAVVAVISGSEWSGDPDSEWFPLLTGIRSLATVQGSEWLGQDAFEAQVSVYRALQGCVSPASVDCVEAWLEKWPADYLYLPKGRLHGSGSPADCCADLRDALSLAGYEVVYDLSGATIMRIT